MSHRIGVLLSGRGSNFEALADSIVAGRIPGAEIVLVVSNREDAPGLARAQSEEFRRAQFRRRGFRAKRMTGLS